MRFLHHVGTLKDRLMKQFNVFFYPPLDTIQTVTTFWADRNCTPSVYGCSYVRSDLESRQSEIKMLPCAVVTHRPTEQPITGHVRSLGFIQLVACVCTHNVQHIHKYEVHTHKMVFKHICIQLKLLQVEFQLRDI